MGSDGGGPAAKGRGGLARAGVVHLLVTLPAGRKSGAFPGSARKPCGEEFRSPKGAATCSPKRKWPPASCQCAVSVVCGQLGLDLSTGCEHEGVFLWPGTRAHPSLCC